MRRRDGFTLIELLVVMAILGTLLALSVPRYLGSVNKAREAVLRENLSSLRDAIDKYRGDTGKYPDSLDELASKRYLRSVPLDPIIQSNSSWIIVAPPEGAKGAVYDIKSAAPGLALDGSAYVDW